MTAAANKPLQPKKANLAYPKATKVVLISTYEMGRQPFGLASPAAWLRRDGASVTCMDLSVEKMQESTVREAALIAIYLPMHTATRLALKIIEKIKKINAKAHLCCFGLYAPVNEKLLRKMGVHSLIGGEFEHALAELHKSLSQQENAQVKAPKKPIISLQKLNFIKPDRSTLPSIDRYAYLTLPSGEKKLVGNTETTRGCKHLCRHCPIVPIYKGNFRIVQREVVMADIRYQVEGGAQHITFGDPDFFNGPTHAQKILQAMHREFPSLTFDATIKIEHLKKHADLLPMLKQTGCVFITSAVEAIDATILEIFEKNHTKQDFIEVVERFREIGLAFNPTFVTFSPWTTVKSYLDLLETLFDLDLVDNISPVQYAIRLLIPEGSRLLELDETRKVIGPFDEKALVYPWVHPDPVVDQLFHSVMEKIQNGLKSELRRRDIFADIWELAVQARRKVLRAGRRKVPSSEGRPFEPVPFLSESWFC